MLTFFIKSKTFSFSHIYSLFPSQPDSFKMLSAAYYDVYLLSSAKSYSYTCSVKVFNLSAKKEKKKRKKESEHLKNQILMYTYFWNFGKYFSKVLKVF